jgi:DNA-binding SARP family transcriptional activator
VPHAVRGGPAPPPLLRIFTLGCTRVETPADELAGAWLEQRPGQLLKLLACERHRVVPTEGIAETLWPNPRTATPNTVRHFVHTLRERLEPGRPKHGRASLVVARRGGYVLDRERVWIDADEFELSVRRGLDARAGRRTAEAVACLEHARSLYRGDFLADEPYAEWAFGERERLRTLLDELLRALSELYVDDLDAATACLERLAELEPFDGEIQRQLLTLWVRQGRLSRAARHYHAFEQRLIREFGEAPDFALPELARLRRQRRRAGSDVGSRISATSRPPARTAWPRTLPS